MTPLNFKLWRVARGLNQAACGQLFGVSQAAVSWWELHSVPEWAQKYAKDLERAKMDDQRANWPTSKDAPEGETEGQWADRMFGPDSGLIE